MDVLLERLVEASADDEELVAEDRRAEVAALDVRDGGQVAPSARARQEVCDLRYKERRYNMQNYNARVSRYNSRKVRSYGPDW